MRETSEGLARSDRAAEPVPLCRKGSGARVGATVLSREGEGLLGGLQNDGTR